MKNILKLSVIFGAIATNLCFGQETAPSTSSSDGKKIFVGLSGAYVNANNEGNLGGSIHVEYFVQEKVSIEAAYTYSTSTVTIRNEYKKFPTSNNSNVAEEKAYNNNHYVNLGARYYILGGVSDSSPFGVYAGLGLGFGVFRSTEFPNPSASHEIASANTTPLQIWRAFYLPISVGADYSVGPGKVFIQLMGAPKLFNVGNSPDKEAYEALYQANIGYKFGF